MHVIDSENVVETIAIVNNYYRLTMHVIESTIIQNFEGWVLAHVNNAPWQPRSQEFKSQKQPFQMCV